MGDVVAEGKLAWTRIRESAKATFGDWLAIGGALLVLRAQAMREAKANSPFGKPYQAAINRLLDSNGLQDIDSHERRGAIIMVEHRAEIERWRNGLDEVARRRANHPNTIVAHWRRRSSPQRSGPKTKAKTACANLPAPATIATTDGTPVVTGRAIHHPQEAVRRCAKALKETAHITDTFTRARKILEDSYPSDRTMLEAWPPPIQAKPPKAAAEPAELHA
jgi:hypothetical protein